MYASPCIPPGSLKGPLTVPPSPTRDACTAVQGLPAGPVFRNVTTSGAAGAGVGDGVGSGDGVGVGDGVGAAVAAFVAAPHPARQGTRANEERPARAMPECWRAMHSLPPGGAGDH